MNKISYFLAVSLLFIIGCSGFVPWGYPENSLNIYNTYWDDFAGVMQKGEIYQYQNDGFDRQLRFKVLQVLSKKGVLFIRPAATDKIHGEYQRICEEAVFLVISNRNYADGASLKDGIYECVDTYTYTTKNNHDKTVYVLVERESPSDTNKK